MLSSLTQLKAFLMPPAMRERTDFDAQLTGFGQGVLAMMEGYCNRRLARVVGDLVKGSANNTVFSVRRYPVETVTAVTLQTDVATLITDTVKRIDQDAGLIHFRAVPGQQDDTVIIEYTGGYWFDTSEEQDGEMPEAATALPADLLAAFNLQMKAVCEAQDLFGLQAASGDGKGRPSTSMDLDLIPAVRAILNTYRRFA